MILLKLFRHCFGEIFEERKQEILQIWTLKFEIQDKREIKGENDLYNSCGRP